MRLRDLDGAALEDLVEVAVEERDDREDLICSEGEAESEDLEEVLDAIESRAFEAAALRGFILLMLCLSMSEAD